MLQQLIRFIHAEKKPSSPDATALWDQVFSEADATALEFKNVSAPQVSIIIVNYNQPQLTFACLESIRRHVRTSYEIILTDSGSSDSSVSLLKKIKNIRLLCHSENIGFLRACNAAARQARAPFLLFLNNDTLLAENSVEALLETLLKHPDCGAAGGKIILPSHLLQEAGSVIWNNGSTAGYGRDDNPDKPQYNYLREVDYCSGAFLMTRASLFRENGFDEKFTPMYYEEADYCLALKAKGFKTLYQPRARIYHREFGSASRGQAIALMKQNRLRFTEKNRDKLSRCLPPGASHALLCARDKKNGPTVLFIDDRIPNPMQGSGYPRSYEMLMALARLNYRVTFFPAANTYPWQPHTADFQQAGIEIFHEPFTDFPSFAQERRNSYDIILISRPHNFARLIPLVKKHFSGAKIIYDAEAIFSRREIMRAEIEKSPVRKWLARGKLNWEISLTRQADCVITVSENEKQFLISRIKRNLPVEIWGHAVSVRAQTPDFEERQGILFTGSFIAFHSPNEAAALYLTDEIWPRLEPKISGTLTIAGYRPPQSLLDRAGADIQVQANVPDLAPLYDQARVFIVPHRFAGGIPLKLQEAMANGIPAVVSEIIAEQLNLTDNEHCLIARDPAEFADKIQCLYENPVLWRKLRANGFLYVQKHCDPNQLKEKLNAIIKQTLTAHA